MPPLIVSLNLGRRPTAVLWFVLSEWINAIERVFRRPRTHVFQERSEIVTPARADRNATSTVVLKMRRALGVAAGDHRSPCPVFSPVLSSELLILPMKTGAILALVAAAALRITVEQVLPFFHRALAAVTLTGPTRAPFTARRQVDHGELAESLTNQIGPIESTERSHLLLLLFSAQAPAALNVAALKVPAGSNMNLPAFAAAEPMRSNVAGYAGHHRQSAKLTTDEVHAAIWHLPSISYNSRQLQVLWP